MIKSWPLVLFFGISAFAEPALVSSRLAEAIVLAPQEGSSAEDREIGRWQDRARAAGAKPEVFERLGWAYVAKARRTLDAGYYKLAEKTADAMEARFGAGAESQLLRGTVLHNLHRFHEAEAIARQLVTQRGNASDLALLSDALMEQGKLTDAIEALQQLVNVRPGLEAYSRIAHLRWLKGDLPGAIAMMELAARSGNPQDAEAQAWAYSRLSFFYLQSSQPTLALSAAELALKRVPQFPPALLARGRVLVALEKTEEAIGPLQRAAELNPLPEYQWWLADVLRAANRVDEARAVEAQLRERGAASDPRTYALFLATRGENLDQATVLAREELENRVDVFSRDTLAWALAAKGEYATANNQIQLALTERTKDARLLLHAGIIARATGQPAEARKFFEDAARIDRTLTPSERALLARANAAALARAE